MLDFARARRTMVDSQLRTFDITDRALLAAMGEVARERFVPDGREGLAYGDQATMLPGGPDGGAPRVMLAPMILGRMLQALHIQAGTKALDVGCGYGYGSAVMARLGAGVTALESVPAIAATARERLAAFAPDVVLREGALPEGSAQDAPFGCILVNGAVAGAPEGLLRQLGPGGRLVCVMAGGRPGKAVLYLRSGDTFGSTTLFDAQVADLAEFQPEPGFVF